MDVFAGLKPFRGDKYDILSGKTPADPAGMPSEREAVKQVRITILSDMAVNAGTHAEWGFSALIEGLDAASRPFIILFDTGAEPETVWFNAGQLGLTEKLCQARQVFLSHDHQDHTAGLVSLRERCRAGKRPGLSTAYIGGPDFFWSRYDVADPKGVVEVNYFKRPFFENRPWDSHRYNPRDPKYDIRAETKLAKGVFAEWYERAGGGFIVAEKPVMLVPGVWSTGRVPRISSYEIPFYSTGARNRDGTFKIDAADGPMVTPEGSEYLDDVPEEHSLVINTERGLIVIAGCGHAGIVNTAWAARHRVFKGNRPVIAVLGGYHLFKYPKEALDQVIRDLHKVGLRYIMGSHCTGFETIVYMREKLNASTAGEARFKLNNGVITTIGTILQTATDPRNGPLEWTSSPGPALNKHRDLYEK